MESPPEWFRIERSSPRLSFEISGTKYTVDYGNCSLYLFPNDFSQFNHIYIQNESLEEEGFYIFNCIDLMQQLIDHDFPQHNLPYPSDTDVEAFVIVELQDIEVPEF